VANLAARTADFVAAIAALELVITNATTDINANDSDMEAIRRLKEQAQSALQSLGFNAGDWGTPAT
jgi:hypothetical protein